jgi:hypothetical protein
MRCRTERTRVLIVIAVLVPLAAFSTSSRPGASALQVELDPVKKTRINVSFTPSERANINEIFLPWGSTHNIHFVAVLPNGRHLERYYLIEDPAGQYANLEPGRRVGGHVDLGAVFKDLDDTLKESHVHLLWAYDPPEQLDIQPSGGWILLPKTAAGSQVRQRGGRAGRVDTPRRGERVAEVIPTALRPSSGRAGSPPFPKS